MKTATFENSVDVLVKAYFNDTLQHGNCSACAVGNLISDAMQIPMTQDANGLLRWVDVKWSWFTSSRSPLAIRQRAAIGYSDEEVRRIENAFEFAKGNSSDQYMFNGLLAVVEVLADIHGIDLSAKQNAVLRFEEIHATK